MKNMLTLNYNCVLDRDKNFHEHQAREVVSLVGSIHSNGSDYSTG